MSSLKEKLDLDEILSILIPMCVAGIYLMWSFYTTHPFWDPEVSFIHIDGNITYLVLAIIFTIAAPALFVWLWFRKKKA